MVQVRVLVDQGPGYPAGKILEMSSELAARLLQNEPDNYEIIKGEGKQLRKPPKPQPIEAALIEK